MLVLRQKRQSLKRVIRSIATTLTSLMCKINKHRNTLGQIKLLWVLHGFMSPHPNTVQMKAVCPTSEGSKDLCSCSMCCATFSLSYYNNSLTPIH